MELKLATPADREYVMSIDTHVDDIGYENRIHAKSGFVIWEAGQRIGTMFHCVLWDNLPFLNFICIETQHRGHGLGTQALLAWEAEMKHRGYKMTLISTQVDERSQHLYRRLGYVDCGGLVLHGTPFDQPMELFLRKVL